VEIIVSLVMPITINVCNAMRHTNSMLMEDALDYIEF
jgi:hypothetical protein